MTCVKLNTDIHNYYEQLVLEKLNAMGYDELNKSADYLADLTCLVLNQLPPRYIRHEVDMAFYLSGSERQQMEMNVVKAIRSATEYLDAHVSNEPDN
jgi:hypothetical protein